MENIKDWLQQDDVLIVDRGFRDSISFLESLGIQAQMPAFLPKGQKQHTADEVFNRYKYMYLSFVLFLR